MRFLLYGFDTFRSGTKIELLNIAMLFANKSNRGEKMLETIIVILLLLWLVGIVSGQMFGGVLHVLLLVAVVIFLIRLLTGRRAI